MNQSCLLSCYSNKRGKAYSELKGSKYRANKLKWYNKVHNHLWNILLQNVISLNNVILQTFRQFYDHRPHLPPYKLKRW